MIPADFPRPAMSETNERIMRRPEVEARTGLSRSTIYAWMHEGRFPKPIALGDRMKGWRASEIDHWINARSRGAQSLAPDAAQPEPAPVSVASVPGMTLHQWYVGMALSNPAICRAEDEYPQKTACCFADAVIAEIVARAKGGADD
jgi:prophage regulatory protein